MEKLGLTQNFWSGKRVFITGHTGFKGSWLSLWLQSLGAVVTGYALAPPTTPSLFEVARVGTGMHSILGDVRDPDSLLAALSSSQAEVVFHLAAQPLVRYSYAHPVETYATNVMGTVNLFEAIRLTESVRAIINVTSDKCYDNREISGGYAENAPLGGYDPYSSSKACAELITAAYRNSYFNPAQFDQHGVALASVRAGNVIGGGDWAQDRLIPDILRALEAGQTVDIRNPSAIRPWQHVLEPLRGYLMLAEALATQGPRFAEAWNFGPAEADCQPVAWIVRSMLAAWSAHTGWVHDHTPAPHEANLLSLDSSKARTRLHWQPRWSLHEALTHITDWHRAYLDGQDMRAVTLAQIESHPFETAA